MSNLQGQVERLINTGLRWEKCIEERVFLYFLCVMMSSLAPPAGESCPENGRSPGSVSTQHSSPRSDFTYGNSTINTQSANTCNPGAPSDKTSASTQPSDVIISRKESEGFGFVIISSLNRPEAAATNGESSTVSFSASSSSQAHLCLTSQILYPENRRYTLWGSAQTYNLRGQLKIVIQ